MTGPIILPTARTAGARHAAPTPAPYAAPTPAPYAGPTPAPYAGPTPAGEPARRRRRWPWALGALVLLIIAIVSGQHGGSSTPAPAGAPAAVAAPVAAAPASAAPVAAAPASVAPAAPAPKVYSGKGDDVVTIDKPSGTAIMTFSCPKCSGNTIVQSDGAEALLVNTIGSYTGKRWLDATSGSTTSRLTIKATGSWKVTIGGLEQATHASGRVAGKGDDVVQLDGSTTTAAVTNRGQGNFIVETAGGDSVFSMPTLPVNEIGSYSGTVPLAAPVLVQVTSGGSWTITPQP